jgi:hypothetical protein
MNWTRVLVGGLAAGFVTNLLDFVLHGLLLAPTYERLSEVFTQEQANPLWFLVNSLVIGVLVAVLFGKSRASWAPGWKGGVAFGLLFGLATFFLNHYHPLVIDGFPYYLAWCWGGVGLIDSLVAGAILGAVIRRED